MVRIEGEKISFATVSNAGKQVDFFDRQAHAQKQTRRLLWLFGLAVVAATSLASLALASLVWIFQHPLFERAWWNPMTFIITTVFTLGEALVHPIQFLRMIADPQLFAWTALATLALIAAGCFYKMRLLADGGVAVAKLLGGKIISADTTDLDERKLRNVVEEMAVAAGLRVPKIYLLERERGINTFAAGHTRDDVAIGVTFGCIKLLTRDELQGVIAHEFSHVLNGDTQLNMKLMALAHGLFWPTILGRVLLYGTNYVPVDGESIFDERDTMPLQPVFIPIAIPLLMAGCFSAPLVRWLKSAICREREWLADAAAVQFTRNPAGIEGALKKIAGLYKAGRLDSPWAETASHLYFANSSRDPWLNSFSTHPRPGKRILAIDPSFSGQFEPVNSIPVEQAVAAKETGYDQVYQASLRRARQSAKVEED